MSKRINQKKSLELNDNRGKFRTLKKSQINKLSLQLTKLVFKKKTKLKPK